MTAQPRDVVRTTFAALLDEALVDTQGLVERVYDYAVGDFGGQSPVVTVTGAGTHRPRMTVQGRHVEHVLDVNVFVLYAAPADGYTEADAENRLDAIDEAIAAVVDEYARTDVWQAIEQPERSAVTFVDIGGQEYKRELLQLVFVTY